jgi:acyl carrier protein phosphodiesterase
MNYLAHATLSFGDAEILTGNMIADHIKGRKALEALPSRIAAGVRLHRQLDAFTDSHRATIRATLPLRPHYGLYAGPIVDTLFDHFLANDPKFFPSEAALLQFSQNTYSLLETQKEHFPEQFRGYFPGMQEHNWLYGYRTLQGMKRSLGGLQRRAQHLAEVDTAYSIFIGHYHELAQCWYDLAEDVLPFARGVMNEIV